MTADALAAHDAALATADERRRAAEDARLAKLLDDYEWAVELVQVAIYEHSSGGALSLMKNDREAARAVLLAYIETIRK
jgi:hypothetical protein